MTRRGIPRSLKSPNSWAPLIALTPRTMISPSSRHGTWPTWPGRRWTKNSISYVLIGKKSPTMPYFQRDLMFEAFGIMWNSAEVTVDGRTLAFPHFLLTVATLTFPQSFFPEWDDGQRTWKPFTCSKNPWSMIMFSCRFPLKPFQFSTVCLAGDCWYDHLGGGLHLWLLLGSTRIWSKLVNWVHLCWVGGFCPGNLSNV